MSGTSLVRSIVRNVRSHGVAGTARKAWRRLAGEKMEIPAKLGMVVVEVTTYCNLKCAGCVRTIMDEQNTWSNDHMPVERFRQIVDSLSPAELFIPQGIGESTMHPRIVELIRIASQSKKFDRIEINSNALVRTADFYGELFDAGLNSLTVSVDSLDTGLIDRVRAGTDIPKLETRLREFVERFPDRIGIRVTVSKWNKSHLPELFRRLDGLGRFNVWLQPFFDMGNGGGVLEADEARRLESDLVERSGEYPNLKITVEPFLPSKDICRSPWKSPAITVDGHLKPCCMILHQEDIHFGDVLTVPFNELWHSPEVEAFREQFMQRSPSCCARCPYYAVRT
jgi:MoaA/NifB/PqqE/SkfB family radical SAM enzyme